MAFTASFGGGVEQLIRQLGVAANQVDNITAAALQDIGQEVVDTLAVSWPLGERRTPSQMGPHSADMWEVVALALLAYGIHNSAPYIDHVHAIPKYGGPPGLADRTVPGLIQQVDAQPLAFMSARIIAILAGP